MSFTKNYGDFNFLNIQIKILKYKIKHLSNVRAKEHIFLEIRGMNSKYSWFQREIPQPEGIIFE